MKTTMRAIARGGLVMALALGPAGCAPEEAAVPPELVGNWTTARPGYEENSMEFRQGGVIFRAAGGHQTIHPIVSLVGAREEESERTRYELEYANEGKPLRAVIYLSDDGGLVFENRRGVVWRRSDRAAAASAGPEPVADGGS